MIIIMFVENEDIMSRSYLSRETNTWYAICSLVNYFEREEEEEQSPVDGRLISNFSFLFMFFLSAQPLRAWFTFNI